MPSRPGSSAFRHSSGAWRRAGRPDAGLPALPTEEPRRRLIRDRRASRATPDDNGRTSTRKECSVPAHRDVAARRTVALVGPSGSGKTSLAEALLWKAGALGTPGSVEKGSTVSDWDPLEKRSLRSLNTSLLHVEHRGITTYLVDTPGAPDF